MHKRIALKTLAIATIASLSTTAWTADVFPSKVIKIVVPYAAGGTIDQMARILAPKLGTLLKQSVMVDNRVGAGTTIGADHVLRSDPDGHTIFMGSNAAFTISPQLLAKTPYDPLKNFAAIGTIASFPNLILVKPDSPFKTLADVVDAAKMGAHVSTLPPNVLRQLFKHVLTDNGLKAFLDDWAKTGQSIL